MIDFFIAAAAASVVAWTVIKKFKSKKKETNLHTIVAADVVFAVKGVHKVVV